MNREKAERYCRIGLFGAILTLIGDCLPGWKKCVGDWEVER